LKRKISNKKQINALNHYKLSYELQVGQKVSHKPFMKIYLKNLTEFDERIFPNCFIKRK